MRQTPAYSIKYQSRPKPVDMTSQPWGPLVAVRKAGYPNWWFTHPGHHDDREFLVNAESVRYRAKRKLEIFCPLCKGGEGR